MSWIAQALGIPMPFDRLRDHIAGDMGITLPASAPRPSSPPNPFEVLAPKFLRTLPGPIHPSEMTSDDFPEQAGGVNIPDPPAGAVNNPATRINDPTPAAGNEIESYIIQSAKARGIDPQTALRVARAEGGTKLWNRQSDVVKNGKRERSYGPFQLYMDGGVGNRFKADTGLDPSDPRAGRAAIDYALDEVARDGWRQWYGAKAVGIGRWDGVQGAKPTGKWASADPSIGAADGPKGQEMYARRGPAPTALAMGLPDEMMPPGQQRLPTGGSQQQMAGGSGRVSAENADAMTQEPETPVARAFQQWKVNKTTRMLRGLSPAATLGVLTAIGQDARQQFEDSDKF